VIFSLLDALKRLAPALLIPGNSKQLQGANHENANCHNVQESARTNDQTKGFDL
jgi:hypothetical protein